MPESRIDYLEAASERDAQTADHGGELRKTLQNRFELQPIVQAAKRVNVLLQPLGDRQVELGCPIPPYAPELVLLRRLAPPCADHASRSRTILPVCRLMMKSRCASAIAASG